ncbi:uncharacterized protein SPSK_10482 [Sporothrix schenckii 1099-18]|uniref:Uncharacterized protein n=1 Tax=Sporothrix schenckii 1099-18 TaxID=1397361 RepID=A0A0F2MBZ6_SPOSC|nr:uncharacterized protein SPSK_10482 [Sporothrix schenckii 1099-18]KJR86589.1 hypothetical protein SPSK_10482 [Sporothrix schenckii 1099-18]
MEEPLQALRTATKALAFGLHERQWQEKARQASDEQFSSWKRQERHSQSSWASRFAAPCVLAKRVCLRSGRRVAHHARHGRPSETSRGPWAVAPANHFLLTSLHRTGPVFSALAAAVAGCSAVPLPIIFT